MPILDIIVPHYDEPFSTGKKLFDILALQRGISFDSFRVLLVHDGSEHAFHQDDLFSGYPFTVHEIYIPHAGVSAARNAGIQASTAPWIMFCDFDDTFAGIYSLKYILDVLPTADAYDVLWSDFLVESRPAQDGTMALSAKGRNIIFLHGKVFRRSFITDNNLSFDTRLFFSEDSCFLAIANILIDHRRVGKINAPLPIFAWCYRPNSATTDPDNAGRNCNNLFVRHRIVLNAFRRHNMPRNYNAMCARILCDYYHHIHLDDPRLDKQTLLQDCAQFYAKHRVNFASVPLDELHTVFQASRGEIAGKQAKTAPENQLVPWLESLLQP